MILVIEKIISLLEVKSIHLFRWWWWPLHLIISICISILLFTIYLFIV